MEPLNTEDASVQKKQNRDEIQKATGENRRKKTTKMVHQTPHPIPTKKHQVMPPRRNLSDINSIQSVKNGSTVRISSTP